MSKKPQQKNTTAATKPPAPQSGAVARPVDTVASSTTIFRQLCIALTIITFLLYANTLQHGFVLDDVIMVKDNTIVAKGLKGVGELLTTPHMRGYLKVPNDDYRPLSLVMFAIERQFFGVNPTANHFFNILVFIGCVLLFFLFLHRFFDEKKPLAAFAGALLFALHPVHTEVVANIKSRDELLCFFFAFLSLNLFMRYMKEGKAIKLVLGLVTLFLSFLAKENVITFLGVIPLLFFFYQNNDKKRAAIITGGSVVVALAFIGLAQVILRSYHANESSSIEFIDNALVQAPNFMSRIATAVHISGKYLALLFVPYPLLCNYSYNSIPFSTFADYKVLLSAAAYLGMLVFAISRILKNKKDPWAFAIMFFLMTISLFTNLFMLIGAEMAERFLFMASAGICMAVAFAADKWLIDPDATGLAGLKSGKVLALLLPLTLVFGGMVVARNKDWKDNVTLYRADAEKSPDDSRLAYYRGTSLAEELYAEEPDAAKRKEIDLEAASHLQQSLAMYPGFAEANAELGRVFDRLQRFDSAEYYDRKALAINPNHAVAMNNLGSVFLETGKYAEAIEAYKKVLVINPGFQMAYFNMARTYNQLKNYDSAIVNYQISLQADPNNIDAHQEIGMAYFSQQRYDSAEVHFKRVQLLNPQDANAVNNLGAIYLNTKNYPAAIAQFKKSLELNPNYVNAYSNMGRAYYFSQQFGPAIEAFVKELSMDPNAFKDIPYLALSYKAAGNMELAKKYEAAAKQHYSDFKL